MLNETFGWLWIVLGLVSGSLLGLKFQGEKWLGGDGSHRRRLIRLGHISFFGLGILNILFAHSLERIHLSPVSLTLASRSLMLGALPMPVCCGLMAWKRGLQPLFIVPVLSSLLGGILTFLGLAFP